MIDYVPRYQWAAKPPLRTRPWESRRHVVVHWWGSPDEGWVDRYGEPAAMRRVQDVHLRRGGFDIFYNFCVFQSGAVYEGRGWTVRGGAQGISDSDRQDISIAAGIGPGDIPSDAMLESVAEFRDTAVQEGWAGTVKGHKDFKPKACPGPDLYSWIQNEGWEDLAQFSDEDAEILQNLIDGIKNRDSSGWGLATGGIDLIRLARARPLHKHGAEPADPV